MNDNANSDTLGGAIGCCYEAQPIIENCFISNNKAYYGGGISAYDSSSPTIRNCMIWGNSANEGGGLGNYYGSDVNISNCTIVDNSAIIGGGIHSYSSDPINKVTNCILWGNGDDLYNCSATYSCIEDIDTGTGNIHDNPCFADVDSNNFHLSWNSPCRDAGDPNGNYDSQVDIDNEPRVYGQRVDIGADEVKKVYNVNKHKWYDNIQNAINEAINGDEIVVLPGIYNNINFGSKAITVRSIDSNDPTVTVIDGSGRPQDPAAVQFPGGEDPNTVLKGFTIMGGNCGIQCNNSNPTISNCVIEGYSGYEKCGILHSGGGNFTYAVTIKNNIIRNNYYGIHTDNGAATIENNQIYGHFGYEYKRGIYVDDSSNAVIRNNQIYSNSQGIYATSNSTVTIRNNQIYSNANYGIDA
jgi:parallel beta-helix repeat protein